MSDRLSELPDDILVHILDLAHLPTKLYVATSILGRRWRFVWALVPNLDLDQEVMLRHKRASSFPSIVNRVMFLHKREKINSFRLRQSEFVDCSDYESEKWITTAIECSVQQLHISLAYAQMPPLCIFTCKTLVNLSISCCHLPPITGIVYLPALKKLQLCWVYVESVGSLSHLLSGCPVLDELFIKKDSKTCDIRISSNTINRLELEIDYIMMSASFGLKLDTPALKHLKFNNYIPRNYSSVRRFASFASAKTFRNLTHIDLEADWQFIKILLGKTDNLQVLTIRWCYGDKNPTHWYDPEQVPACLVSHLETVRIHGFWCTAEGSKAVRYVLKNAKVLKRMEIYAGDIDSNKQLEAVERVTLFERGSDACQLAFH